MKQIVLPGTDLSVSRFSFGTGSLVRVLSQSERARLLAAAHEAGFTHFDTAPYYGYGLAERELGAFLASRPDVTITTKVGLYSPGGEESSTAAIVARKIAGRVFPALTKPVVDFAVARAKASLDASLRRLRRARVDVFLLHEAEISLIDTDEWLRWLEGERDRVGHFGIALATQRLRPFLDAHHPLARIVQTQDSLDGREADVLAAHGRTMQFTYGYMSSRAGADPCTVLAGALNRNRTGSVIVSTTKAERLQHYVNTLRDSMPAS